MSGRRERHVSAFTSDEEFAQITAAAKHHNLSISAFVRAAICECCELRPFFTQDDRLLIGYLRGELKQQGLKLTEILIHLNRNGKSDDDEIKRSIFAMQRTIAGLCVELLERTDPPRNYRRGKRDG